VILTDHLLNLDKSYLEKSGNRRCLIHLIAGHLVIVDPLNYCCPAVLRHITDSHIRTITWRAGGLTKSYSSRNACGRVKSAATERGNDCTPSLRAWQSVTCLSPRTWLAVCSDGGCSSCRLKTLTTSVEHFLSLGRQTVAYSPQDSWNKFLNSDLQITR
jgi:hypothetical protein